MSDQICSNYDPSMRLTARQVEVVSLFMDGLSGKQVAALLRIEPSTVSEHADKAMRALGAHNRTELVIRAIQHGFLPLPPPRAGRTVTESQA